MNVQFVHYVKRILNRKLDFFFLYYLDVQSHEAVCGLAVGLGEELRRFWPLGGRGAGEVARCRPEGSRRQGALRARLVSGPRPEGLRRGGRPCPSLPFSSLPLLSLSRAEVPAEESGGPRGASLLLGLRPLRRGRSGACSPKRCVCRPSGAENWFLMLQQHINPSVQHLALYQNTEIISLFKATDVKIIFSVRSH